MNSVFIYLIFSFRVILGIIWIWASINKIQDPAAFARAINNYHVIPFGLENTIAIFLPWLELIIGIFLISGILVNGASFISSSLLFLFIILITQAILRGFNIDCGCGLKEGQLVGWNKIVENIFLLATSYCVQTRKTFLFEPFSKTTLSDNI
tara:strand:+ start:5561 stop:6016 length:456 start_codon:yes stop_codon:yes gene_type:complete